MILIVVIVVAAWMLGALFVLGMCQAAAAGDEILARAVFEETAHPSLPRTRAASART